MGSTVSIPTYNKITLTESLINEIGVYINIDMNKYHGRVVLYHNINYLIYTSKLTEYSRSIYTIDLRSLYPTGKSPIQTRLSDTLTKKVRDEILRKKEPATNIVNQTYVSQTELVKLDASDDFHPI